MISIDWKEMPNLSEITLVVPTYNRQNYALRQMNFWSNSTVEVHILDGTKESIRKEQLKNLGENIHYHHMPVSYTERMSKAVEMVNTLYVSLICDDDFFIPRALDHCVAFLKSHRDYVACAGRIIGCHSSKKGMACKQFYYDGKKYDINGETAKDRMVSHVNPWRSSTIYAVHKYEVWKNNMTILTKYNFSTPYVGEILFEMSTCYQGKFFVIQELMRLKDEENIVIDFDKYNRKLLFEEWIRNPKYAEEVKLFYEGIGKEFTKIGGENGKTAPDDFLSAVNAFLNRNKKKRLLDSSASFRDKILHFTPDNLQKMMHSARIHLTWKKIMNEAKILQKEGVIVDIEQLREIVKNKEEKI